MKIGITVVYGIVMIMLVITFIHALRNKKVVLNQLKWVLGVSLYSLLSCIVQVIAGNELVSTLAYDNFFVSVDWLLFALVWFSSEYCEFDLEKRIKPWFMVAVCMIDSLSLQTNFLFHHAFTVSKVIEDNSVFYTYKGGVGFQLHLFLAYVLVFLCFVPMFQKMLRVPKAYKAKYVNVLVILSGVVVLDLLQMLTKTVFNFSVVGYPLAGIAVYFYSVEFMPKRVMSSALVLMNDSMQDGVMVYDYEQRLMYANDMAKKLLKRLDEGGTTAFRDIIFNWCRRNFQNPNRDFIYDWTLERDGGEKVYFKVRHQRLMDEKNRFIGGYIEVQDRTNEVNTLIRERYLANHDRLTGLYNKEYFYEQAEKALKLHPGERYLMVCSDVYNFKLVNDVFGHKKADELLVNIARAIEERTIPGEIYGRLANDRFALLMRKKDFREIKFVVGPAEVVHIEADLSFPLTTYIGVYEIDDPDVPIHVACDRAMMAINDIKGDYQKRVAYYDIRLRNRLLQEKQLIAQFEESLVEKRFELYLQPQVTIDGKSSGAEALARWNHPTRGLLLPEVFLPILEKSGMITKLDKYMWERACQILADWKKQGKDYYISVNVSNKDFLFLDIFHEFSDLVTKYDVDPSKLKIEITESAVMSDLPKQAKLIERLQRAGFVVEMDDFGSGYSSLSMLKSLAVDVLKIDLEFLQNGIDEDRCQRILKAIMVLSRELNLPVIVEGVETAEHLDYLQSIGCETFQGYYFAKPMSLEDFEQKYF